jgi:Pyruvate/2-oxoacid:ferredoxin oxidoreductase delta subunit
LKNPLSHKAKYTQILSATKQNGSPLHTVLKKPKITKLFHDVQIKMAFCTQNTIQNILKPDTQTDKCKRCGIYQREVPVHKSISDKQKEHLIFDIKNAFTPSETAT